MSLIWRTKDLQGEATANFEVALREFDAILDGDTDLAAVFSKYDKVRECKKGAIIARGTKHAEKYAGLCDKLRIYEEKLLMYGIDLKKKKLTTNSTLLSEALRIEKENTSKLVGALAEIHSTLGVAGGISSRLAEDRDKIDRISLGLDGVESELSMANKRITNFAKRLSTDKVFIAMTTLVVAGAATAAGLHFIPPVL